MKNLTAFSCHTGFSEFADFTWTQTSENILDEEMLSRLGYLKENDFFAKDGPNWIEVYGNHSPDVVYRYMVAMCNSRYSEYIFCKKYVDYLELIKQYLPVVREMNAESIEVRASVGKS